MSPGPASAAGEPRSGDQAGREHSPVAAFDFDGTITRRDTMLLFLTSVRSRTEVAGTFLRRSPQLVAALRGGAARDRAKRLVSRDLLGGLALAEANDAARDTASTVTRTLLRDDTVARLRWHQRSGHRVVVVSASFEAYVRPVAGSLGVHDVIATGWEVDDGVLTGELSGRNVRGAAKVELLAGLLGEGFRLDYAYGNSGGDSAMLARAHHAVRVGRRRLPEQAPDAGTP